MPTRIARSPDTNFQPIRFWQSFSKRNRVAIIPNLLPRIDLLTRLAVTAPEITIIENQRRHAGLAEDFGEPIKVHFLDG
ncbi:hypothetical protein SAMN05421828_1232 [Acidiphilium rubrum]|uniref:Uncharacterized protein n=1 Tax=Acidiphilium rubrum TaxID=526 RepID=A0A8G2CMP4_ACIRU|nr:hypothetical protein SAMN05421828_1232 [Acidiphilium rubrum]